jgi:hypothetical protein
MKKDWKKRLEAVITSFTKSLTELANEPLYIDSTKLSKKLKAKIERLKIKTVEKAD